jgi:hypothetical protein
MPGSEADKMALAAREKREHPRRRLMAHVRCRTSEELGRSIEDRLMQVGDASLTGLFLHGHPILFPELQYGVELELSLVLDDDPAGIHFRGKILRVDDGRYTLRPGFGVLIVSMGEREAARYRALFGHE